MQIHDRSYRTIKLPTRGVSGHFAAIPQNRSGNLHPHERDQQEE